MTSILAMEHFQETFKSGKDGPLVSLIFSIYSVGNMIGSPFAAMLSDKFGRRKAMFCGGCVIILGMIIISTSSHLAQFVVGRFVLGFGIAIMVRFSGWQWFGSTSKPQTPPFSLQDHPL
jgi:MFS family permease